MVHRPTDPRSPVQSQRGNGCLPFLLAGFAALAFWTWQNSDRATDWWDNEKSSQGQQERAKANLVQLFSTDDYPMEAIRNNQQGTVGYRLTVNRRGRVSDCAIVQSSGSKILDEQTCRILSNRARFQPARDVNGKRIGDTYSGRIRWELPKE